MTRARTPALAIAQHRHHARRQDKRPDQRLYLAGQGQALVGDALAQPAALFAQFNQAFLHGRWLP